MANLKEERILILEMVKENKISADDAAKLLNSLQGSVPRGYEEEFDNEDLEGKFNKFYTSVDTFAKDLKQKLDKAFKETEPKFKKATKSAMEKTAVAIENLSKTINESAKKMDKSQEPKEEPCSCETREEKEEITFKPKE